MLGELKILNQIFRNKRKFYRQCEDFPNMFKTRLFLKTKEISCALYRTHIFCFELLRKIRLFQKFTQ